MKIDPDGSSVRVDFVCPGKPGARRGFETRTGHRSVSVDV
ncbi:hypothetical protein BN2537_8781 [Streptomyces venezuelae]|nr:hypothetical protein BN2537_8781 [Streptomyces venezuelae]